MFALNQQIAAVRMLSIEELCELNNFVVSEIKRKRNRESQKMKHKLSEGDTVTFKDNHGHMLTGEVVRVMRKFARVKVKSGVTWRVPMSSLAIK